MNIFTQEQINKLSKNSFNGILNTENYPVVKLYIPLTGDVWLLTELDTKRNVAFGLHDTGNGLPCYEFLHLNSLKKLPYNCSLNSVWSVSFEDGFPLSVHANAARLANRITDNYELLLLVYNYL